MSRHAVRLVAAAFLVLFLVSVFVPTIPEGAYSDATVLALYDDAGARWRAEIAGAALTLAAVALLAFLALTIGAADAPRHAWLGRLSAAAGTAYAVMLMVTATAFASLSAGINVGELPSGAVTSDAARVLSIVGFYGMLVPGSVAAGVMVAALSRLGRVTGMLPRWCARVGYLVALLCLVPVWPTQFLPPLWVLAAGLALTPGSAGAVDQEPARTGAGHVPA